MTDTIDALFDAWLRRGLSTERLDRTQSESAIAALYRLAQLPPPAEIKWYDDPAEMCQAAADYWNCSPYEAFLDRWLSSWWYTWFSRTEFALLHDPDIFTPQEQEQLRAVVDIFDHTFMLLPYDQVCFACDRPRILRLDEDGRLHSEHGPALGWTTTRIYAWHDVLMPAGKEYIIDEPERITIADIDNQPNVEVRRVMIERMGWDRFLQESGAQLLHADDTGELYRRDITNDEPVMLVRVTNSTPEPDGTHKQYVLRVPPTVTTAREAVAWTFGLTSAQYVIALET